MYMQEDCAESNKQGVKQQKVHTLAMETGVNDEGRPISTQNIICKQGNDS